MTLKLERTTLPISELVPSPINPRTISNKAMKGLKASLKRYGVVQEIVVNRRNKHVVGGHQRIAALIDLGETSAPVTLVDIDETEEQALNATLNNPHIAGSFTGELQVILDQLKTSLPKNAMEDLQLDQLLANLGSPPALKEPSDEEKPEVTCPKCGHEFIPN